MDDTKSNNEKDDLLQEVLLKAEALQKESALMGQAPFLKRLKPILNNIKTKFFLIKLLDTGRFIFFIRVHQVSVTTMPEFIK